MGEEDEDVRHTMASAFISRKGLSVSVLSSLCVKSLTNMAATNTQTHLYTQTWPSPETALHLGMATTRYSVSLTLHNPTRVWSMWP